MRKDEWVGCEGGKWVSVFPFHACGPKERLLAVWFEVVAERCICAAEWLHLYV